MSSSSMEVTSSSSSREIRKIRKPLMERKRRARINDSLDALQRLLTEAEGKDLLQNRQTKLEKADILEMTVRHLQNLNRQQKSSQCRCLTTKHTNNSGNNYCITTSATRGISRINNFSKKSTDRCSTTPDTNELHQA
ncbi:transcription factor HES-4-like [Nilaparvata lugens]|uniref:transcription factor HES-4-like n=1 Tax=Nilaparvata lugens TaxID=108931 RepID=UPI00193C92FD|nr:transcription factor HES-4-like [Nilaparvata lugens]